jgi:hypothetical protein
MTSQSSPRLGVWLFLTIGLFCLLQILTKAPPEERIPGPDRGDLVLHKDVLPALINEWKCVGFDPAAPLEQLPKGQYWWTHSWKYSTPRVAGIVCFDQAGFADWHELTVCYRAADWIMKERRIVPAVGGWGGPWNVVVAEFERGTGDRALLAFSFFDQDGQPIESPDSDFRNTEASILDRFQGRVNPRQFHERAMQSQVFAPHQGLLSKEAVQEIIELHLQTRDRFRDFWLANRRI